MSNRYDVVIIGGGIVGNTLALILANANLRVALVEALPKTQLRSLGANKRTIVLSYSSRLIFEALGCWPFFENYACPIHKIHISDRGQYGTSKIEAHEENIPALGYVLSANAIGSIVLQHVYQHRNITVLQPAQFCSHQENVDEIVVTIRSGNEEIKLRSDLLIAADGHNSAVRKFQGIGIKKQDYQQTAIFCNLELKRSHQNTAYERFTSEGPLAILPLLKNQAALIWTVSSEKAKKLMETSDPAFLHSLQDHFGYRLGRFLACSERGSLPLSLITAEKQISSKVVLVGNAAHTLHPVAGQGLNLALRDIAVLAEELLQAKKHNLPLWDHQVLRNYFNHRQVDQRKVIGLTNSLVGLFSTSLLPIMLARSSGLILLDRLSGLKKTLTRTTLGFSGKVPRLACGLTVE